MDEPGAHNEETVRAVLRMVGVPVNLRTSVAFGRSGKEPEKERELDRLRRDDSGGGTG